MRTVGVGEWEIVQGFEHNAFAKERIAASIKELKEEIEVVKTLLGNI